MVCKAKEEEISPGWLIVSEMKKPYHNIHRGWASMSQGTCWHLPCFSQWDVMQSKIEKRASILTWLCNGGQWDYSIAREWKCNIVKVLVRRTKQWLLEIYFTEQDMVRGRVQRRKLQNRSLVLEKKKWSILINLNLKRIRETHQDIDRNPQLGIHLL